MAATTPDLFGEKLISFSRAAKLIPPFRGARTIYRWCIDSCRLPGGSKLGYVGLPKIDRKILEASRSGFRIRPCERQKKTRRFHTITLFSTMFSTMFSTWLHSGRAKGLKTRRFLTLIVINMVHDRVLNHVALHAQGSEPCCTACVVACRNLSYDSSCRVTGESSND
jgi:hypothetical protein